MIAQLVAGKVDLADVLFLIAGILFGIVCVVRAAASDAAGALVAGAAALVAIGWFVL